MSTRMPHLKIRWKLIATLSVPLLVLAFVVGAEVRDRRVEVRENRETKQLIEFVALAAQVRNEIQVDFALSELPRSPEVSQRITRRRARTLADVGELEHSLAELGPARFGPDFADSAGRMAAALPTYEAAAVRGRVDAGIVDELAAGLVELGYDAGKSIERHGDLARRMLGYAALHEYWEKNADLLVLITGAANGKRVPQATVERIAADRVEADLARELFESTASDADISRLEAILQENASMRADLDLRTAELTRIDEVMSLDAATAFPPMDQTLGRLGSYVDRVGDDLAALADRKSAEASSAATWFVAIAIGATLLSLALALLLVLSMGRRLDKLVNGAQSMAERQLPAMVESLRHAGASDAVIREPELLDDLGRDEIGELGDAFNAVQRAFVEVASDQAELLRKGISDIYVRLARRNQSLVERQIALLDRLEAIEKDPDILENLFRLDHLATRIRRNAESLLVLAGTEPARKWSAPVPLAELLRAATAEVEDYSRIHIVAGDETGAVTVPGPTALHLTHLFAELIENAVQFSPPGTVVEVVSRRRSDSYTVYVSDSGMGMTDEQLAEANELLASPPDAGLDLSRTLGLYVVARLATRYGATVRLARSPYDGIVASVALPLDLVSVEDDAEGEHGDEQSAAGSAPGNGSNGEPTPLPVRPRPDEPLSTNGEAEEGATESPVASNGDHSASVHELSLPRRASPQGEPGPSSDVSIGLAPSNLSPEARRSRLSRFREGLELGHSERTGSGDPAADAGPHDEEAAE